MASSLPKHYSQTLSNGMQVVAIPLGQSGSTNVVSVDIFYKVGSRNEMMGKSGMAHMLEHLNFKSTKNLKAGEFDEIVKGFGGVNNASTGFDYTHYFINASRSNMPKALELFSELMQNQKLDEKEFLPERDVVAEERRWRTDNSPMGYLFFRLFNESFVYHPYHWTPIGFMDDILSWKIDDIKNFHQTYYHPSNAVLVVSGDVKPQDVFDEANRSFGHIAGRGAVPQVHSKEPELLGEKLAVVYKESNVEMLSIAYHIPNFESQDVPALSALAELIGSGKSSRLQKRIVEQKRLANSLSVYPMDLKDPGLFIIIAVCNEGVPAEKVEKEILNELETMKAKGPSQKEVEKVKINTKADFIFGLEQASHVSDLFGSYLARGNLQPLLEYEDRIEALNAQTVQKVAQSYLVDTRKTTIILRKQKVTK